MFRSNFTAQFGTIVCIVNLYDGLNTVQLFYLFKNYFSSDTCLSILSNKHASGLLPLLQSVALFYFVL